MDPNKNCLQIFKINVYNMLMKNSLPLEIKECNSNVSIGSLLRSFCWVPLDKIWCPCHSLQGFMLSSWGILFIPWSPGRRIMLPPSSLSVQEIPCSSFYFPSNSHLKSLSTCCLFCLENSRSHKRCAFLSSHSLPGIDHSLHVTLSERFSLKSLYNKSDCIILVNHWPYIFGCVCFLKVANCKL